MEIERKFLVDDFPTTWPLLKEAVVYQGYISTKPVVRIRSSETPDGQRHFVLCFKGKGTLVRQEIEMDLEESKFHELETLLRAPMIRKDYKVYVLPDGHKLEVSLVDGGTPTAFMYAEVEFDSVEAAHAFQPVEGLKEEVTEAPWFSMSRYWQRKVELTAQTAKDK